MDIEIGMGARWAGISSSHEKGQFDAVRTVGVFGWTAVLAGKRSSDETIDANEHHLFVLQIRHLCVK